MLERKCTVTSDILGKTESQRKDVDAVIVAADITLVDNIAALKSISKKLTRARQRIFVIDGKGRLAVVQAYALGATHVLGNPVNQAQLLAKLAEGDAISLSPDEIVRVAQEAASAGAVSIASMFSAVMDGAAVDVAGAKHAGSKIAESDRRERPVRMADDGSPSPRGYLPALPAGDGSCDRLWIEPRHGEGRCRASVFSRDVSRHRQGKDSACGARQARSPRSGERALIETHPAAGYEVLKGKRGISPEILDAVRHHHEYLDGSGYPDALCAASINDIVRILTISDIFAALIEHRTYKPTLPREKAYEILLGMHGKLERRSSRRSRKSR